MQRKHLRLLVHLTRGALLAVGSTAAATAAIWTWQPDWVDRADAWFVKQYVGRYRDRLDMIRGVTDPARQYEQLTALVNDLAGVRRQDRLADVVADCYLRLSQHEEARGDVAAAARWMLRSVEFDDHSLHNEVRLCELSYRLPEERADALSRLQALAQRHPGNPFVAPVLATLLARDDQPLEAAKVIASADDAMRSRLWTISWDAGTGIDRTTRRCETVPVYAGGELLLRFSVDEPIVGLSLVPPTFHCAVLEGLRLEVAGGRTIDLLPADATVQHMDVGRGRAATWGGSGPWVETRWREPIAAGTPLVVRARELRTPLRAFAAATTEPALVAWIDAAPAEHRDLAARLRRIRAITTASGQVQVFWAGRGEDFAAERSRAAQAIVLPDEAGGRFDVEVPLDTDAHVVRVDLPEGIGTAYGFERLVLAGGDGPIAIDAAAVDLHAANGCERRDGRYVVTGRDPYFVFTVPGAPQRLAAVMISGVAR
jgi:hypothetical protein